MKLGTGIFFVKEIRLLIVYPLIEKNDVLNLKGL